MADGPPGYQQLFDPEPTQGHYYSLGSAVLFGGGRLLLLSLRTLGLLAWVVLRRRRGKAPRLSRAMLDADFVTFEYTGRHLRAVLEDPFLRGDWEAAGESFAAIGVTLPPHDPLGALFSFDAPTRPMVKSRLATIYNPADAVDEAAGEELAQRLRAFTDRTGGNARSLFAALRLAGGGYGHAPGVIAAALDVLERQTA